MTIGLGLLLVFHVLKSCRKRLIVLTDIIFVLSISSIHHLQKFDFDLCLIQKRLFVLDYLNRYVTLLFVIERLHHLSEASFTCGGGMINFFACYIGSR
jgi:DNA gyrase/topoisomerase IV subunit B